MAPAHCVLMGWKQKTASITLPTHQALQQFPSLLSRSTRTSQGGHECRAHPNTPRPAVSGSGFISRVPKCKPRSCILLHSSFHHTHKKEKNVVSCVGKLRPSYLYVPCLGVINTMFAIYDYLSVTVHLIKQ